MVDHSVVAVDEYQLTMVLQCAIVHTVHTGKQRLISNDEHRIIANSKTGDMTMATFAGPYITWNGGIIMAQDTYVQYCSVTVVSRITEIQ